MIPMLEPMLSELREEAVTTKRVLERVPADQLSWKPHPRSMSLGQLALHVATIPGSLAKLAQLEEFDASQASFDPPVPGDLNEIHTALDQSVRAAEECLRGMSETAALGTWRLTLRGKNSSATAEWIASLNHAEPLVPSSGPIVSLSPSAGCSGAGNLWSQRG